LHRLFVKGTQASQIIFIKEKAGFNMKVNKFIIIAVILFGLLGSILGAGLFLSQGVHAVNAASPAQEDDDDAGDVDDDNGDVDDEDGDVNDDEDEDNDDDEGSVSPDQAGITADEAKAAAEAANPETKALEVELENEKGTIVYEVELDNSLEVIMDAANGAILGTEDDGD
jgi:uncharacterized membrane protein YkoI